MGLTRKFKMMAGCVGFFHKCCCSLREIYERWNVTTVQFTALLLITDGLNGTFLVDFLTASSLLPGKPGRPHC